MKVIGLDKSMTSTGLAVVDDTQTETIRVQRITSQPAKRDDGLKPSLQQRHDRMVMVEDRLMVLVGMCPPGTRGISRPPALVVIEGPAYAASQGAHDIGGSWWRVVNNLLRVGIPVAEVSPSQVKQYATGSGSTSGKTKVTKQMVIDAVRTNYGDAGSMITQTDEADALILAAIGCRYLGRPIESHPLPAANLAALKKIRWPERTLV